MIAVHCPNCSRIQHIKDQGNEQEYKSEDGPQCCGLSDVEKQLIAAVFGKEFDTVTIKEEAPW